MELNYVYAFKVVLILVQIHSKGGCYDIFNFNKQLEDPILNSNTVCKNTPSLNREQMRLCKELPDVVASALQGMQYAVHECQAQFRYRRWNCSSLEMKNRNPMTNPLLNQGFRETAFVHAIASAGVTSAVAKACSIGKLATCACDESMRGHSDGWQWGGCGDNMKYGAKFSTRFLDSRETGRDIHSLMNLHNNFVGRKLSDQCCMEDKATGFKPSPKTVMENSKTKCKCHGMCGSCSVKTCWKTVPDFREVGDRLLEKYDYATLIRVNNRIRSKVKLRPVRRKFRRSSFRGELVYFEKSPDFCKPDQSLLIQGTAGRVCSRDSLDTDNCKSLCCNRPYVTKKLSVTKKCRCHFNWCCYVICDVCEETSYFNVCM